MNAGELAKERERRMLFARAVYEQTVSGDVRLANMHEVGESLGFDSATTQRVMDYLNGEGLVKYATMGGNVAMTHAGRVEVERAISNPDQPTHHFAPINVINIGAMHNSQIVQGSPASTQTQNISLSRQQLDEVANFARRFRQALPELNLSETDRREAEADLKTAEEQSKSTKPKIAVLNIVIAALGEALVKAGASTLKDELLKHLPRWS